MLTGPCDEVRLYSYGLYSYGLYSYVRMLIYMKVAGKIDGIPWKVHMHARHAHTHVCEHARHTRHAQIVLFDQNHRRAPSDRRLDVAIEGLM